MPLLFDMKMVALRYGVIFQNRTIIQFVENAKNFNDCRNYIKFFLKNLEQFGMIIPWFDI